MPEIYKTALQLHLDGRNDESRRFVQRKLEGYLSQEDRGRLEAGQNLLASSFYSHSVSKQLCGYSRYTIAILAIPA